jgi:hypothetical protein
MILQPHCIKISQKNVCDKKRKLYEQFTNLSRMWPFTQRYERVTEMETGSVEKLQSKFGFPSEKNKVRRYFIIISAIAMTSALAVGFLIHLIRIIHTEYDIDQSMGHCGNTTSEAKANGCKFDLLSYSWMPEACFDHQTATEFEAWMAAEDRALGSWPFFEDREGTRRIMDKKTLSERTDVWTYSTDEEHFGHCLFLARRLHRIVDGEARLSSSFDHVEHTVHCTSKILEDLVSPPSFEAKTAMSRFKVVFDTCF